MDSGASIPLIFNKDLANAIDYNILRNCQLNQRDIQIANNIFGPSVAAIKGKSIRQQNKMKRSDIITDLPQEILDAYEKVHLDINIMFVNKCAYFTAISKHIGLIYCVPIASRENKQVADAMQRIIDQYRSRRFKVTTVNGDNEFKGMDKWMTDKSITLNTCDTNEHVPTIERTIRFLKERIRCIRIEMSFSHIPKWFLIKVVAQVTILVNSIPRKDGVHAALSPREIICGKKLHTPKYKIGQYIQEHLKSTNDTGEKKEV